MRMLDQTIVISNDTLHQTQRPACYVQSILQCNLNDCTLTCTRAKTLKPKKIKGVLTSASEIIIDRSSISCILKLAKQLTVPSCGIYSS